MSLANIHISQLHVEGETYDPNAHPSGVCAFDAAIVFSAECTNNGEHQAGAFGARFVIDGHEAHNEQVHGLAPGESHWAQWRHNALHEGEHSIFVAFDPTDHVHESDEQDNSYTYPFHVEPGHESCRTVTMEAETVTGHVDPHGAAQHGWHQIDVSFVIKDPRGGPIRGYRFFSQFFGPEGQESQGGHDVGDSALNAAGILTRPNVWLQQQGSVRLMGVADMDSGNHPGPMLEGVAHYHLAAGATALTFNVDQGHETVTVTASSQQEASDKVTAEGHAGIQIEIVELGGSVGTEHSHGHTEGQQVQYQVTLGTPALTLTQT
jgi:CARDB